MLVRSVGFVADAAFSAMTGRRLGSERPSLVDASGPGAADGATPAAIGATDELSGTSREESPLPSDKDDPRQPKTRFRSVPGRGKL